MHRSLRELLHAGAIAATTVLFQLPFFDRGLSTMDEGHVLQFADLVASGGELYRDATLYPLPGAFYLLALAFRFLEPSILVARWIVVLEFAVFAALVHFLLRRLVSAPFALFGVFCLWLYRLWTFPHWHIYNYSTTGLLVLLASQLVLLAALERDDRRLLALSGFLFGLGVLCKQDYGAVALLATLATLGTHARVAGPSRSGGFAARAAVFLLPAALVGIATGLHFLRQGLLPDLLRFTVLNHFVGMSSYEYDTFPALLPLLGQDRALRTPQALYMYWPSLIVTADLDSVRATWLYQRTGIFELLLKAFFYGPYLLLLLGGARLWRRRSAFRDPAARGRLLREVALYAFALGLVILVTLNRPQDYVHLAVLYWPLICLAIVYLHALTRGRLRALPTVAAVAAAALLAAYTAHLVQSFRVRYSEPILLPRAGVKALPVQARLLEDLVGEIQTSVRPEEGFAAIPYLPVLHFLADRRGPHRTSYILWPFPEVERRDEQVVEAMERERTPLVVYHYSGQFPTFPPFEQYAPAIHRYLVDHYEIERLVSYDPWDSVIAVLRRDDAPEPGRAIPADGATIVTARPGRPPIETSAGQARDHFEPSSWPFEPAWMIYAEPGSETALRVAVDVAPGERLRTAVAVHPDDWCRLQPASAVFAIDVEADGRRQTVFTRVLLPTERPADRGWFPVEVPLERFAGGRVLLTFRNRLMRRPQTDSRGLFSWATPRLVRDRPSGEAPTP